MGGIIIITNHKFIIVIKDELDKYIRIIKRNGKKLGKMRSN